MTSKFDELKQAYEHNRKQWRQYEQDCLEFCNQVRQVMADYLGCDISDVRLMPLSEGFQAENLRSIAAGRRMWLDNDAFWHFHLQTVLERTPKEIVRELNWSTDLNKWVTVQFMVKKLGDTYIVKPSEEGRLFRIEDGDVGELVEYIHNATVNWLEQEVDNFVRQEQGTLGFPITTG